MRKIKWTILVIVILLTFFIGGSLALNSFSTHAQEDKLNELRDQIQQYQQEINRLQSQANTLSNQIAQFDAQIRLTTLKIAETEEKILLLGGRIDQLEVSLNALNTAFSSRAIETYKMVRVGDPLLILVSAPDLSGAVTRYHYLQRIQEADRDLLERLQTTQDNYKVEKEDQEDLQTQLEQQKRNLDNQKAARANLLAQTRNDERRYQQLLAQARAEYEAIQAIIAGRGQEIEVGKVSEGQRIASIIQGPSCNSSGTHLHFIVSEGGTVQNPFNYLKGGVSYENCSGSSCGSGDGDPFNPSGSWEWPTSPPIKMTQGYGTTWAVQNTWVGRIYSFHNGIDINSLSSAEVRAVKAGTLFRGSYSGQSCALRYVRVKHDDANTSTFYLHVDY